jgi:hypothetical protein
MKFRQIIIKRVLRDICSDLDLIDISSTEAHQIVSGVIDRALETVYTEDQPSEKCDVQEYKKLDKLARSFLPDDLLQKMRLLFE